MVIKTQQRIVVTNYSLKSLHGEIEMKMHALMRKACCLCGSAAIGSFGFVEMGCAGSYDTRIQVSPLGIMIDVTFVPLLESEQYDLDGMEYFWIVREGKSYKFYPGKGWVFDPETGQLYQLDDKSWRKVVRELGGKQLQTDTAGLLPAQLNEVARQSLGIFQPTHLDGLGIPDTTISIELSLSGDTPIPALQGFRWPTLKRQLFIFPNGEEGIADDLRLQLDGDPSDVLGYLAAVGATNAETTIDGHTWNIVVTSDDTADVFIDDVLLVTIPLH